MRNWPFSLQFRLIASFVLVLALTLSAVSWFVSTAFEAEAEQQQHEREDVRAARVQATFAAYFDAHGSWEGVEPVLEQASFLYGWRIVLSDNHERVLGDSHGQEVLRAGEEHEQKASESGEEHKPSSAVGMPVLSDGEKVGSIRFILDGPLSGESHEEPSESDLITRVNRSLIWTGLAVGGAGVLLIAFISRRVLSPIRNLSAAAVQFGKGDLSQRVAPATRDDVGQLGETFNAMAEELQRTELQRRNLMADIAHELRTPLANVQGYVEAIGDGILRADETTIETLHRQIATLQAWWKTCGSSRWRKQARFLSIPSLTTPTISWLRPKRRSAPERRAQASPSRRTPLPHRRRSWSTGTGSTRSSTTSWRTPSGTRRQTAT